MWIEAESAEHQPGFKPFEVISNRVASGGGYVIMKSGTVTSPPEDGIAAYTFYAGGDVRIWILLNAPTRENDSLFLKLDDNKWMTWDDIEGAAKNLAWVVWQDFKTLPDDIHTLQIARREDGVKIDKILITNDLDFIPPPPPAPLSIEAESASGQSMFPPFKVRNNRNASGGQYIVWANDGSNQYNNPASDSIPGQAAYTFILSQTADVTFEVHALFATAEDDSFYYKIDNGPWIIQSNVHSGRWQIISVTTFVNLPAGQHTLTIQRREDGSNIDMIMLTATEGMITYDSLGPPPATTGGK